MKVCVHLWKSESRSGAIDNMKQEWLSGWAAHQCGKVLPLRARPFPSPWAKLSLANTGRRRSVLISNKATTVRQSLTALCCGEAARRMSGRDTSPGTFELVVHIRPAFRLRYLSLPLVIFLLAQLVTPFSFAQRRVSRTGAHSSAARAAFTPADRRLVERAIGQTCTERTRDPFGSMPIDEMQSRPSLPIGHPEAVAGLRRAERVLPTTRRLVASTILQLAKEYDLYGTAIARSRINAATARVEAVRRIRPDVDSRDNASVLLREPRTIEFGTIFLAGLRSDEAMISVLAHDLTHIANGQPDSLRPLFRAIARRAATRTGLRIQGQRAEELSCDLVGMLAARQFIKETPSL